MVLKEKMTEDMSGNTKPGEKQKMMNAMMEQFCSAMSAEEKQKMMEGMMEKFMGTMSAEERKNLMRNMMPKMMGKMMTDGSSPMMGMMSSMMGKMMAGKNKSNDNMEMPWDMCKKMMSNVSRTAELASYATPELRGLFEEWLSQIEEEIRVDIEKEVSVNPEELAKKYKLSKESIHFILETLGQKEKISIKAEKK